MRKIAVIGSGFSGLSAAATLASRGCEVHVFEKNKDYGGRARQLKTDGYVFDMGPSWYWMPEVFERFFNRFNKSASDYYKLVKLSPSFVIHFGENEKMEIPESFEELCTLFERIESGSGDKLRKFMKEAAFKYETGINDLVYKPGLSFTEFLDARIISGVFRLQVFSSFSKHVRKYFKDPRLISLMEFPVLFLGARPKDTPALYSLMNYAGLSLGTWYPMGGFYEVIKGMKELAGSMGVNFHNESYVTGFDIPHQKIDKIYTGEKHKTIDGVIAAADYQFVEQKLLPQHLRTYSPSYWNSRVMAPSALIFYLGINKRLKNLHHHNLFFDADFEQHSEEIYTTPQWPTDPLFYVCCPSVTDSSVAPEGCENVFILMPLATGLTDTEELRESYFTRIMDRLEKITGQSIRDNIKVKHSYCINDFVKDYNAYKGNAYGLANTLKQTANFKPSLRSKKVSNLFYTGQLTVPGPGVPPAIISGQVAAVELLKNIN